MSERERGGGCSDYMLPLPPNTLCSFPLSLRGFSLCTVSQLVVSGGV